jgi:hypothetical protein
MAAVVKGVAKPACRATGPRPFLPQSGMGCGQWFADSAGTVVGECVSGWNPKVFSQVGVARAFSKCAGATVALMSTVMRPPSAPGAAFPASDQVR